MAHHVPTSHIWSLQHNFLKILAYCFIVVAFISFVTIWGITYSIRRDCHNPYIRSMKFPGYWVHIQIGSTNFGCTGS